MRTDLRQVIHILFIVLAGAFASGLMFWITAYGPGVTPDSTAYLASARSVYAGGGFYIRGEPMVRFAPVYPLLLAVAGRFHQGGLMRNWRPRSICL